MAGSSQFSGLKALGDRDFPKSCPACGKTYRSEQEYIQETRSIRRGRGDIKEVSDDGETFIEVFRNCICGSTLLGNFGNRRDMSAEGDKRRALFDHCLDAMVMGGMEREEARKLLRQLIRATL